MTASPAERLAKDLGQMCFRWDCTALGPRHAILWRCGNGHEERFWYCAAHIQEMAALALTPPGFDDDGVLHGVPLCRTCKSPVQVVLEAAGGRPL